MFPLERNAAVRVEGWLHLLEVQQGAGLLCKPFLISSVMQNKKNMALAGLRATARKPSRNGMPNARHRQPTVWSFYEAAINQWFDKH